jgi:membrane protein
MAASSGSGTDVRSRARLAARTPGPATSGFFDDGCTKLAAAITYYALLSMFPLAILVVAGFGLVIAEGDARTQVIDAILDVLPLQAGQGRAELARLLDAVTAGAEVSGVVGLIGLVYSASGVMAAVRFALNRIWDVSDPRPLLRGKAVDLLLIGLAGITIGTSLALTIAAQALGAIGGWISVAAGQVLPGALAFGVFLALLRLVPVPDVPLRDACWGALVGAAGYTVGKLAFGFYLSRLADFGAVYASLGTVVAFLVFVWVSSCAFLLGAEVTAVLPEVRRQGGEEGDAEPLRLRLTAALRGLLVRPGGRGERGA